MGKRVKKAKVAPTKGSDHGEALSKEAKEELEIERQTTEAQNWMSDKMCQKLCRPYKIQAGIMPSGITKRLPSMMTKASMLAFLFGRASEKDLRGLPAAGARLAPLSKSGVQAIKKCFDNIDVLGEGKISVPEFMDFINVQDTTFSRQMLQHTLFNYGDMDGEGVVEFPAFLLATVVICTYSRDQVMHQVFSMFDADGSGYLDLHEMSALGKTVAAMGAGTSSERFTQKVSSLSAGGGLDVLNFEDFVRLNADYPMLFYPAFKLQDTLRKKTLGAGAWMRKVGAWDKKEKQRAKLLEATPRSFGQQVKELGGWYEEQRAAKGKGPARSPKKNMRAAQKAVFAALPNTKKGLSKENLVAITLNRGQSLHGPAGGKLPPLKKTQGR